jgi:hypothetical protein
MSEKTESKVKSITLLDGSKVEVRPLKISLLKPFMKRFEDLAGVSENNDESMDVLLDCVEIAFKQYKPELAESREALEDNIDLPTVYEVIDAASGIQLTDPTSILSAR